MKAILRTMVVLFAVSTSLFASAEGKSVVITLKDGTTKTTPLSDVAKMTVNDGNVTVMTTTATTDVTAIGDINSISFKSGTSRTANVTDNNATTIGYPNPCYDELSITGITQSTPVEIYTVDSKMVKTAIIDENSSTINISSLIPGTYIVKTGDKVIKIVKK